MRLNIYKEKILKLLKKKHLLSISDIHKKISGADYSTVFRNIEKLCSEKKVKKVILNKDKIMYEIKNTQNTHDHFVCDGCGKVDELKKGIMSSKFLKKHKVIDVLIRGFCNKCN